MRYLCATFARKQDKIKSGNPLFMGLPDVSLEVRSGVEPLYLVLQTNT